MEKQKPYSILWDDRSGAVWYLRGARVTTISRTKTIPNRDPMYFPILALNTHHPDQPDSHGATSSENSSISTSSIPEKCYLVNILPTELRLRIYDYVFTRPCEPLLIIRNNYRIEQPHQRWFPDPGMSLLKTCRTIYYEAAPIMYSLANFRIQMSMGYDNWPAYPNIGPMDSSNPLLAQIQNLDITFHLRDRNHIDGAIERLELFAKALEDARADLKSLHVSIKTANRSETGVTPEMVVVKRDERLFPLWEGESSGVIQEFLFYRMLSEARITRVN